MASLAVTGQSVKKQPPWSTQYRQSSETASLADMGQAEELGVGGRVGLGANRHQQRRKGLGTGRFFLTLETQLSNTEE